MPALSCMPRELAEVFLEGSVGPSGFLLLYLLLINALGCIIDAISMMLILLPIVLPVAEQAGFDLSWFGVLTAKSEPLGARGWTGTGLGLAGVVLLIGPGADAGIDLGGVGAILLATALWAVGTLHHRKHVRSGGALTNAGLEMLAAGLLGGGVAPFFGGYVRGEVTTKALVAIAYLVVFGSVLAYTAHTYLSKAWNPVRAGTYAYLNPVIAVLLGSAFLRELFNVRMAVGMAVILAGVALVQYRSRTG